MMYRASPDRLISFSAFKDISIVENPDKSYSIVALLKDGEALTLKSGLMIHSTAVRHLEDIEETFNNF